MLTERFTISRKALTCASDHSSQRITGMPVVSPPGQDPNLQSGLQPEVAVHDFPVAARENRDLEAELADAGTHAIHRGIVLARVAGVEDQAVDGPDLNLRLAAVTVAIPAQRIAVADFIRQQTISN